MGVSRFQAHPLPDRTLPPDRMSHDFAAVGVGIGLLIVLTLACLGWPAT
jgi:hypothetical protein